MWHVWNRTRHLNLNTFRFGIMLELELVLVHTVRCMERISLFFFFLLQNLVLVFFILLFRLFRRFYLSFLVISDQKTITTYFLISSTHRLDRSSPVAYLYQTCTHTQTWTNPMARIICTFY